MGPFFPVKEFLSQIYGINHIIDLRMISDELILAGKLQLKKLQKKKPEKKNFQASFSAISLIAVYLRGSIRHSIHFILQSVFYTSVRVLYPVRSPQSAVHVLY